MGSLFSIGIYSEFLVLKGILIVFPNEKPINSSQYFGMFWYGIAYVVNGHFSGFVQWGKLLGDDF